MTIKVIHPMCFLYFILIETCYPSIVIFFRIACFFRREELIESEHNDHQDKRDGKNTDHSKSHNLK